MNNTLSTTSTTKKQPKKNSQSQLSWHGAIILLKIRMQLHMFMSNAKTPLYQEETHGVFSCPQLQQHLCFITQLASLFIPQPQQQKHSFRKHSIGHLLVLKLSTKMFLKAGQGKLRSTRYCAPVIFFFFQFKIV